MLGKHGKRRSNKIDTLVGQNSELQGDLVFTGGLHIDGRIKGNVIATEGSDSTLTLSNHGRIEGEVRVPYISLNGEVMGDVYASEKIELASHARIKGDVYYNLLEMAMGAEVNGSLVHQAEVTKKPHKSTVNTEQTGNLKAVD